MSITAVVEGSLRRLGVSTFHGPVYRVQREVREVVGGLREIPLHQVPFLSFVELEAKRLAAVDDGLGPDFRRARESLIDRLRRWPNAVDVELLRTLELFGDLARRRGEVLRPALEAFLRACAREPAVGAPARAAGSPGAVLHLLAERLEALERRLLEDAEGWERFDGNDIAREQRAAAVEVVRARALLA